MILMVKGADFSENSVGKFIDYSYAKSVLNTHYPTHSDDDTAEAYQVFVNALGKGTEGSIWDRLRWLILPIFGNSVTEDVYDAKNLEQGVPSSPDSLIHSGRGVVFNSSAETPSPCSVSNLPTSDTELGSIFYVRTDGFDTNNYMGNGGDGGYIRPTRCPTLGHFSKTYGGDSVGDIDFPTGRLLMFYQLGSDIGDTVKFASENGSSTFYIIRDFS